MEKEEREKAEATPRSTLVRVSANFLIGLMTAGREVTDERVVTVERGVLEGATLVGAEMSDDLRDIRLHFLLPEDALDPPEETEVRYMLRSGGAKADG